MIKITNSLPENAICVEIPTRFNLLNTKLNFYLWDFELAYCILLSALVKKHTTFSPYSQQLKCLAGRLLIFMQFQATKFYFERTHF